MDLERELASKFREGKAEGLAEGKAEGLIEGAQQKAIESARSFFANGASLELISKSLNMSIKEVREITKDIKR